MESKPDEEKKNISVKGVNKELYRKVMQKAVETGKSIGELTNDAYKALLSTMETAWGKSMSVLHGGPRIISDFKSISISDTDLKEIGKNVFFRNIGDLDLSEVTSETFEKYVDGLVNIDRLIISNKMKKSLVLLRGRYINKIDIM
ncbi:MAG: hypothetical protein M1454_03485 [Candidatus Thermoplasmatota archaeon]|nr:hypothetical protein [Candidatus Thermoplasmatota archaeon]MCL5730809.1 hypothetical protein [Candidatus Thermoplasmatota archaeon]